MCWIEWCSCAGKFVSLLQWGEGRCTVPIFSSLQQRAGPFVLLPQVISNPAVGFVAFTGSVAGGKAVYKTVAHSRFIDATLELGGKDAAYVCEDADFDAAVDTVVDGAFYNAGQSCCAIERVYVHRCVTPSSPKFSYGFRLVTPCQLVFNRVRLTVFIPPWMPPHHPLDVLGATVTTTRSIYPRFCEAAKALIERYSLGDPLAKATSLGPMALPTATAFLKGQVEDAVRKGARVLTGGKPCHDAAGKGRFFQPTLVVDCTHSMSIVMDESFGPVVAVMAVDSDVEAVRMMNDSSYGLTAAVFTKNADRANALGAQLQVGTVYMNR